MSDNKKPVTQYFLEAKLLKDISKRFTYHALIGDQPERYNELRSKGGELATLICLRCPDSRERALALTNLEEAIMWANAAIARNETNKVVSGG